MPSFKITGIRTIPLFNEAGSFLNWEYPGTRESDLVTSLRNTYGFDTVDVLRAIPSAQISFNAVDLNDAFQNYAIRFVNTALNNVIQSPAGQAITMDLRPVPSPVYIPLSNGSHESYVWTVIKNNNIEYNGSLIPVNLSAARKNSYVAMAIKLVQL